MKLTDALGRVEAMARGKEGEKADSLRHAEHARSTDPAYADGRCLLALRYGMDAEALRVGGPTRMISEQDLRLLEEDLAATHDGDTLCIETDAARELIRGYRFYRDVRAWIDSPHCVAPQEIINIYRGDNEGPDDGDELYPERNR